MSDVTKYNKKMETPSGVSDRCPRVSVSDTDTETNLKCPCFIASTAYNMIAHCVCPRSCIYKAKCTVTRFALVPTDRETILSEDEFLDTTKIKFHFRIWKYVDEIFFLVNQMGGATEFTVSNLMHWLFCFVYHDYK